MIYTVVERIPRGRVATYGQVAQLANLSGHARQVGYALHALPMNSHIPWHRVINARGEISSRHDPACKHRQRHLLEKEGVVFDGRARIALLRFRWKPRRGTREP